MTQYQYEQITEKIIQRRSACHALMETEHRAYTDALKVIEEHYEEPNDFHGKYGTSKEAEAVKEKLEMLPTQVITKVKDAKAYTKSIDDTVKIVEDILCEQREKKYPYSKDTANKRLFDGYKDRYAAIKDILPSSEKDDWGDYGK